MGRDWTPREYHRTDILMGFSSKPLITTDLLTGTTTTWYDPTSPDALRWKNTTFLANEILDYNRKNPQILDLFEKILTEIIDIDDSHGDIAAYLDTPLKRTIHKWYYGKLDPAFYYSDRNNDAMNNMLASLVTT